MSEIPPGADNVTKLPIRFKGAPRDGDTMLKLVERPSDGCNHTWTRRDGRQVNASYLIREGETEVECSLCGTRLDPMFVLRRLAIEETNWHRTREAYTDEMKRLRERQRTKCEHCGQMTRISRR